MVARAGYNTGYLDIPTPQVVVKPQILDTFEVPITRPALAVGLFIGC